MDAGLRKADPFMVLVRQQLEQELSVFERGLNAEIIFEEIWNVEGASKVSITFLSMLRTHFCRGNSIQSNAFFFASTDFL